MRAIELLDRLKNKAVFGIQDIERIADCDRTCAEQTLRRLKKRNCIKHLRRNAYTTKDNIHVIASNIVFPSYISFWSASSYLGYTEQILNTVQLATTRNASPIEFEGNTLRFIQMKHFFGYRKLRTSDGDIFIAEDEKLLIDAFLKPKACGNFDEIRKIYENARIKEDTLTGYLKDIGSQMLIKRVGYLLEKAQGTDLSEHFTLDRNYAVLDPFFRRQKGTDQKWRVRL